MTANYRILTADRKIKNAGTDSPSWFTLEMAKKEVDYSAGEMVYEFDYNRERLYEVF